jgi:hypothetical protein
VSTKHFCEECGKEISLKGNDYCASQAVFGRTAGNEDGWKVTFSIRREYSGSDEDLCAQCVLAVLDEAMDALGLKRGNPVSR